MPYANAREKALGNKKMILREGAGSMQLQKSMYKNGDLLNAGIPQKKSTNSGTRAVDSYNDQERSQMNEQYQKKQNLSSDEVWSQYAAQKKKEKSEPTYEQQVATRNAAIDARDAKNKKPSGGGLGNMFKDYITSRR